MGRRVWRQSPRGQVFGLASIAGAALGLTGFALAQDKAGAPTVAAQPPAKAQGPLAKTQAPQQAQTAPGAQPTPGAQPAPGAQSAPPSAPTTPGKTTTLSPADLQERVTKARDLTHQYKERLAAGIVKALKEGGPKGAIGACNTLAPELNHSLTEELTFEIARTALKVRNPENAPDAWELKGLEAFQKEIALGTDPKKMEIYDIAVTSEGQSLFRYLRPIVMGEPCLVCHGPAVTQEIKSEIAQYYPDDKATGFSVGELRGAFSLIQQLD